MGLRHLRRNRIDTASWDAQVAATPQALVYNYSWYLDAATAGRWNAIVANDYQLLLPLPFNRKRFGLPQVYMPPLCQQLGFFDTATSMQAALNTIPSTYPWLHLHLRSSEQLSLPSRSNLLLDLSPAYEQLRANYSRSLRKRLKKAEAHYQLQPSTDVEGLINLYQQQIGGRAGLNSWSYERIGAIIRACLDRNMGQIQEVIDQNDQLQAMGFFAGQDRLINLFGASTAAGRSGFAMHYLLDQMITAHAEQATVFDFEGSQIPGVRSFFMSFGAEEELYYSYNRKWI